MKKAIFILSFDCEAKWGMADHIDQKLSNVLNNSDLIKAYLNIMQVLKAYKVKATFAFVSAMVLSQSEFLSRRDWFASEIIQGRPWLEKFHSDVEKGNFEGWLIPELLDIVQSDNAHEIASHGFTHLPLSESLIDRNSFLNEMKKMKKIMNLKGENPSTFVYPRNLIGYSSDLNTFGIKGYRNQLFESHNSVIKKIKNISSEFNLFQKSQQSTQDNGIVKIPSGYFLNWRSGERRLIPIAITEQRWRFAIKHAIEKKMVIHLWTHPHNFLTGHKQFNLLQSILKMVREAEDNNQIKVMTQHEYCEYLKNQNI